MNATTTQSSEASRAALCRQQLDDLVQFLKWTSRVDTEKWPPNKEG